MTTRKGAPRALDAASKDARRTVLLDTAARLFEKRNYDEITMAEIARRARVAKGTVFIYFPTKEAIFLALTLDRLKEWFVALEVELGRSMTDGHRHVPRAIARTLHARPPLLRLLGLLHGTLERNVDVDTLVAFKRQLLAMMEDPAAQLEARLPQLRPGDGARLLLRLHALVVGLSQMTDLSKVSAEALEVKDLAPLRVSFVDELEAALSDWVAGWRAGGRRT